MATPFYFSLRNGHFLSSLKNRAVDRRGRPIPWYSYPAIDFLSQRNYAGRSVLEFGAGYSTLFWSMRCDRVLAFEGDPVWYKELAPKLPPHVDLKRVSIENPGSCLKEVQEEMKRGEYGKFDLIIIDGLWRKEVAELSRDWVKPEGAIVTDDSEGYGFFEVFKDTRLNRVDFFGHCPGVILPHCTSIYFKEGCFLFNPSVPLPDIAFS